MTTQAIHIAMQVMVASRCYAGPVRTTVNLEDDVAAAVEQLRRDQHIGLSEAVNRLVRAGLHPSSTARRRRDFTPASLGLRLDVSNVAEVLDRLDEEDAAPARPR